MPTIFRMRKFAEFHNISQNKCCEILRNSVYVFHQKFRPLEVKNYFLGHPIGGGVVALYKLSSQGADSLPPPLSGAKAGSNHWNE
jgi:hypothetical protein